MAPMSKRSLLPPIPARHPATFTVHGDRRRDEYSWLQKASKETLAYVAAENAYADKSLAPTKPLQDKLYREIRSRMIEDDRSVPVKHGPFYYYTRTKKGFQYPIHCRTYGVKGKEQVILDQNALAKGKTFFSLGAFEVSPDHTKLAYSVDTKGDERYTLYVKDLVSGELLSERIPSADGCAWAADSEHVFYAKEIHPFPPRTVMRHKLGAALAADTLVYDEKDKQWAVSISESADRKYVLIHAGNFDTSECWYIPANAPHTPARRLIERTRRVRYSAEHAGEFFYIMTNKAAVNFKIQRTKDPERARSWETWLPHSAKRSLTGFYAFTDFVAVTWRENGGEELYVTRGASRALKRVVLPESAHAISVNGSLEFDSPVVQFQYQSFIAPRTVYDFDPRTERLVVRKTQKVPRWNASKYAVRQEWAQSGGIRVPVSIVYPNARKGKPIPFLLDFYGSYGYTNDPFFSISRLSLLERGWGIAIAHPRGGGELGWGWHKSAVRKTKHRTYLDVIAVADHLVAQRYTSRAQLFLTGGSAGGMTLGAVLNLRPDIAAGGICYVPDADVVTSSLDTTLGGTLLHYDELGDPRKPDEYRYLKRWSPYENVLRAEYPSLLVRASLHDIRTPYWEAAKWVARLRERATFRGPLFLKIENHAGHGGKSGRYEWIRERAYDYAYLLNALSEAHKKGR